jgi:hypothetical protein
MLTYEKKKVFSRHKSSKECLRTICCGNISGNHKTKLIVTGEAKRKHNHPKSLKQIAST